MTTKKYRVHDFVKFQYSEIGEYVDENHTDKPLRNDEIVDLLNEQHEIIEQFTNIARKCNIPFDKLCDAFEKSIDWDCETDCKINAIQILRENEQLREALKNTYINEICEVCEYGKYERNWYGEGDFECLKKHFGNDVWKCDGLEDCDDFKLRIK